MTAEQAIAKIRTVAAECSMENWDGYGAWPVSPGSVRVAVAFVNALPRGVRIPDIGACGDGLISAEWCAGPDRQISMDFADGGSVTYAALIGPERDECGAIYFDGTTIPQTLLNLIDEVLA